MRDNVFAILRSQRHLVLATTAEHRPHCSLMAYLAADNEAVIYLLTSRSSRKYHNIMRNPHVSLLLDTRNEPEADGSIMALTLAGVCAPMAAGQAKEEIRQQFASTHSHLGKLLHHPDTEVLETRLESALLLMGANTSSFLLFPPVTRATPP